MNGTHHNLRGQVGSPPSICGSPLCNRSIQNSAGVIPIAEARCSPPLNPKKRQTRRSEALPTACAPASPILSGIFAGSRGRRTQPNCIHTFHPQLHPSNRQASVSPWNSGVSVSSTLGHRKSNSAVESWSPSEHKPIRQQRPLK